MHVCCIVAFSCYCFATNATYRLVQVKWFSAVIQFEVLPHYIWRVQLWNQFHLCFYFLQTSTSVTSGLLLVTGLSCCTLCYVRGRAPPPHTETEWLTRGFTSETWGKQTSMQMEIIEAGKIIELICIYCTFNWFIDCRDRPSWAIPIPKNLRQQRLTVVSSRAALEHIKKTTADSQIDWMFYIIENNSRNRWHVCICHLKGENRTIRVLLSFSQHLKKIILVGNALIMLNHHVIGRDLGTQQQYDIILLHYILL